MRVNPQVVPLNTHTKVVHFLSLLQASHLEKFVLFKSIYRSECYSYRYYTFFHYTTIVIMTIKLLMLLGMQTTIFVPCFPAFVSEMTKSFVLCTTCYACIKSTK